MNGSPDISPNNDLIIESVPIDDNQLMPITQYSLANTRSNANTPIENIDDTRNEPIDIECENKKDVEMRILPPTTMFVLTSHTFSLYFIQVYLFYLQIHYITS
jgi:hypothetical protein